MAIISEYLLRNGLYTYNTSKESVGQSFTTLTQSDTLSSINIAVSKLGTPGDITINLYATSGGLPTGSSLSSGTLLGSDVLTDVVSIKNIIMTPVLLDANTKYAFSITYNTVDDNNFYYIGGQLNNGDYSGGSMLVKDDNVWEEFAPFGTNDLYFQVNGTNTVNLTMSTTNGNVDISPDKLTHNSGSYVTLTATPDSGYTFKEWTGTTYSIFNPLGFTINSDENITAVFEAIPTYTLTTSATNGSISKSPDQPNYISGTSVSLNAIPADGYVFKEWTGDVTGTANPTSITMDADKSVTAVFELDGGGGSSTLLDGLVSYYKCDDNAANTTVLDSHGNNNGTASDITTNLHVTGHIEGAFNLDGNSDYFDTFKVPSGAFSISMWVNSDSFSGNARIFDSKPAGVNRGFRIYCPSGVMNVNVYDGANASTVVSSTALSTSAGWQHVVITSNSSGDLNVYLDNLNVGSNSTGNAHAAALDSTVCRFGANQVLGDFFDGQFDEIAIFDKELSSTEVSELNNSGAGLAYPFGAGAETKTATITGTAHVQKRTVSTINGTAYLNTTNSKQTISNAFLQLQNQNNISGDAFIEKVGKQNIYSEAYLHKVSSNDIDATAFLKASDNKYTINSDAYLEKKTTSTINSNAYLFKVLQGNLYANAYLNKVDSNTINSDVFLHKINDKTIIADAFVNICNTNQVTGNAFLEKKLRNYVSGDASLWQQNSSSVTADAFIFRQFKYKPVIQNITREAATASNVSEVPTIMWIEGDTE